MGPRSEREEPPFAVLQYIAPGYSGSSQGSRLSPMRQPGAILLVACYELGHQPLAVAWPAAFLEAAGYRPALLDVAVEPFDPEKYHDEYRQALMQLIEAKLEGQELEEVAAPKAAKVTDLMAALKASVEAQKKKRAEADEGEEEEERPRRRAKAAAG